MLPVALSSPVIKAPVVANTATLEVPPMLILALPPDAPISTRLVPLLMLATEVITPVKNEPLPRM